MALQRTFSIIKPDAVAKNVIGEITTRFEKAGLRVVASKMVQLSEREAAGFYAEHGAPSQAAFRAAMTSPATEEKLNAANAFAIRSGVQGTPTLIINGRYRVTARSLDDTLAIADQLIARERAAR